MADMDIVEVLDTIDPDYFIPIHYLEGADEPKCARQIADALEIDITLIFHGMRKLLKYKEVEAIELNREIATRICNRKINRRTCFYVIPGLENPLQLLGLADLH